MDGRTIDGALRACPVTRGMFRGVLPADARAPCPSLAGFYVYNTDEAHEPGQHWVAQHRQPDVTRHFDSYGLPPFGALARGTLAEDCGPVRYSATRLQGSGKTCGHFCLYYALFCADPNTYPMTVFSSRDFERNDEVVVRLTRSVYGGLIEHCCT